MCGNGTDTQDLSMDRRCIDRTETQCGGDRQDECVEEVYIDGTDT